MGGYLDGGRIAIDWRWLKGSWLRGTQVQHWLWMVVDDIPALAPTLLRVFPAI